MPDRDISQAATSFRLFAEEVQPKPEDMAVAGEWIVEKRRRETLAGISVEGGEFAPYSPEYVSRKGSSGVNLYSANRKLKGGEHMLDALTYKVEPDSTLDVGIFGNAQLALEAEVQNEGATFRTRLGYGSEGFHNHPGRRQVNARGKRGKASATIPARHWLGATDADLTQMQQMIADAGAARVKEGGS